MKKNNLESVVTKRAWHQIDAKGQVLGNVATEAARLLRGKHKVEFRLHKDVGDIVVIINAKEVVLTGNKETEKKYIHHTMYPGGLREVNAAKLRQTKPDAIIINAISGMLPKNKLRDAWLKRLKVYASDEHPHKANLAGS